MNPLVLIQKGLIGLKYIHSIYNLFIQEVYCLKIKYMNHLSGCGLGMRLGLYTRVTISVCSQTDNT